MYIYGVIKGEEAADAYCLKRWGDKVSHRFVGDFAHLYTIKDGKIDFERTWQKLPGDEQFMEYVIMVMKVDKGTHSDYCCMRDEIYSKFKAGTIKLIKV